MIVLVNSRPWPVCLGCCLQAPSRFLCRRGIALVPTVLEDGAESQHNEGTLNASELSNHVAWIAVLTFGVQGRGEGNVQAKVTKCPVTWASEGFSPSEEQEGPLDPENLRRKCSTLQGRSSVPAPCPPLELEA